VQIAMELERHCGDILIDLYYLMYDIEEAFFSDIQISPWSNQAPALNITDFAWLQTDLCQGYSRPPMRMWQPRFD